MNFQKAILWLSGALYLQSMVLPVLDSTPGWEAFRMSMRVLLDLQDFPTSLFNPFGFLLRASGVGNILFFTALFMLLRFADRILRGTMTTLAVCTLLNGQWMVFMSKSSGLKLGYYMWLGAFLLLTVAAFMRRMPHPAATVPMNKE